MTIRSATTVAVVCALIGVAAVQGQGPTRKYIDGRSAAEPNATPLSGAVLVGDTLYLSGQLGASTNAKPETAEAEAKAVLDKVKAVLEKAGMTMDDLVSVQIFAPGLATHGACNSLYRPYSPNGFPARSRIR